MNKQVDIAVVGGGIAGLLAFRRLKNLGFSVVLLEKECLGGTQTLASQGIIHGGTKYALQGKLSDAATSVAEMTTVWAKYLSGEEVDLSAANVLSPHHYLWASGLGSSLKTMIGSKVLSSGNRVLRSEDYPAFFQDPEFKGSLCELDESVLDVPSLVRALVADDAEYCLKVSPQGRLVFRSDRPEEVECWKDPEKTIRAQYFVLMAGEGNQTLMPHFTMQRRPLHMVMVKHPALAPIYVHSVGLGSVPEMTITAHPLEGQWIWYLGGKLAEEGVARSEQDQWKMAARWLKEKLAWKLNPIAFDEAEYASLRIDRAEIFNGGKRPDSVGIVAQGNVFCGWPTKLTLAPLLVETLIRQLPLTLNSGSIDPKLLSFPKAPFGKTPWEMAKWEKIT
jgi:FAD dependent oxidoreductase